MISLLVAFIASAHATDKPVIRDTPDAFLQCHEQVLEEAREQHPDMNCFIGFAEPGYRGVFCNSYENGFEVSPGTKVPFIGADLVSPLNRDEIKYQILFSMFWNKSTKQVQKITAEDPVCYRAGLRWWSVRD